MKRYVVSAHTVRKTALRGALAVGAISALFLAGLLSPGTTQGNSAFDASGISALRIDFRGVCLPGDLKAGSNITAGETIDASNQKIIELENPGEVFGCLGVDDNPNTLPESGPMTLIIDSELFDASNIAAETVDVVTANTTPTITIQDLQDEAVPPNTYQHDLANGLWPASGQAYIEEELVSFTLSGTSMTITARDLNGLGKPKQEHPVGSFVRLQGKLKLVGREQPTYSDGDPSVVSGATTAADHAVGAAVKNPLSQLTCRIRTDQVSQAGPDDVTSRSRCYTRLEPDPPWPDPYDGPLLALAQFSYHSISVGTIDDEATTPTTKMSTVTDIFGFQCFPYIEDALWVKITSNTTIDKDTTNKSSGEFRIATYNDAACTPPATSVLGGADGQNISSTPLVNQAQDTDGDGCTDAEELGANELNGGKRDPYNPYDYYDVQGPGAGPQDGYIDLPNDILGVILRYTAGGGVYSATHDRGAILPDGDGIDDPDSTFDGPGPSAWNRLGPDGTIDLPNDILGVIMQYQHDCGLPGSN